MPSVYVIAAYDHAPLVRAIHSRMRALGITPTSSGAEQAHGAEQLELLSDEACARIWRRNRDDMAGARIVLVLADTPTREGHCEADRGIGAGHRMVWVGRPTLSARASTGHIWYVDSVDAALAGLVAMAGGT
jgi:hypothetical protein